MDSSSPPGAPSLPTAVTIQTSVTIIGSNPADGSAVGNLPDGVVAISFTHPLAFTGATPTPLVSGGLGVSGAHPYALFLGARGPTGIGGATGIDGGTLPLPDTTRYVVNGDGTATIVVTPSEPLSTDVFLLSVGLSAYTDLAGNPLTDLRATVPGFRTFLFQPPNSANPPIVTGITAYIGASAFPLNQSPNFIAQPELPDYIHVDNQAWIVVKSCCAGAPRGWSTVSAAARGTDGGLLSRTVFAKSARAFAGGLRLPRWLQLPATPRLRAWVRRERPVCRFASIPHLEG